MPLQNAMRCSRGTPGACRVVSTQTLTAQKCTAKISFQSRVRSSRTSGTSATTSGSSRTLDKPTAIAVSISAVPEPSAVSRITCAGPAHISAVDSIAQPTESP